MKVYLDNAATTPLDTDVLTSMMPYMTEHFGNPSTQYSFGRDTRAAIEDARKTIAQLINAQPGEIVFTSGATEANNTAIKSAVISLGVQRIISTKIEHHCVEYAIDYCRDYLHIETIYIPVDFNGNIDLVYLEETLKASDKKTLVSLMHVNNEIGAILDVERVGQLCKQYNALFHSDTVQSFAHFPIDVQRMQVDFLSASAHKFHGPKGIGFLYVRKQNKLQPLIHGGGQERGLRSGTENVYGIVGMATAAKKAYTNLGKDKQYLYALKQYFIEQLKSTFSDIDFNGKTDENSLYTVLNVSFPPNDKAALLLFMLDMEGVCCSGGSACGSGASAGSHVIRALNKDENRVSIRFSFSKYNTKDEIDFVIDKLKKIYEL